MSELKYKVGDRVRIKSIDWYNENKSKTGFIPFKYANFIPEMSRYCGEILTIKEVVYEFKQYLVSECSFSWTDDMIDRLVEEESKPKDMEEVDMGEVSDGCHTFNELYEYRMLYNAAFFNEFAKQGLYDVHKSRKHSDGEYPFGDSNWFIVMAELPTGQISNHYEMKDWHLFQVPEKEKANVWDGHTPKDAAERVRTFLTPKPKYPQTYEECCEILNYKPDFYDADKFLIYGFMSDELRSFQKLLVCRSAYWKLYGDEMGLDKPWEPSKDKMVFSFYRHSNEIETDIFSGESVTFEFPTEEMRDFFKENFDTDIEICKEFL